MLWLGVALEFQWEETESLRRGMAAYEILLTELMESGCTLYLQSSFRDNRQPGGFLIILCYVIPWTHAHWHTNTYSNTLLYKHLGWCKINPEVVAHCTTRKRLRTAHAHCTTRKSPGLCNGISTGCLGIRSFLSTKTLGEQISFVYRGIIQTGLKMSCRSLWVLSVCKFVVPRKN